MKEAEREARKTATSATFIHGKIMKRQRGECFLPRERSQTRLERTTVTTVSTAETHLFYFADPLSERVKVAQPRFLASRRLGFDQRCHYRARINAEHTNAISAIVQRQLKLQPDIHPVIQCEAGEDM